MRSVDTNERAAPRVRLSSLGVLATIRIAGISSIVSVVSVVSPSTTGSASVTVSVCDSDGRQDALRRTAMVRVSSFLEADRISVSDRVVQQDAKAFQFNTASAGTTI